MAIAAYGPRAVLHLRDESADRFRLLELDNTGTPTIRSPDLVRPISSAKASSAVGGAHTVSLDGRRVAIVHGPGESVCHVVQVWEAFFLDSNRTTWTQVGPDIFMPDRMCAHPHQVLLSEQGNLLIVAVPGVESDDSTLPGTVRIHYYRSESQEWRVEGEVMGAWGFGASVSFASNRLVIGEPLATSNPSLHSKVGAVHVYERIGDYRQGGEPTWKPLLSLAGEQPDEQFGASVSVSVDGVRLAVGSPGYNGVGRVQVFELQLCKL